MNKAIKIGGVFAVVVVRTAVIDAAVVGAAVEPDALDGAARQGECECENQTVHGGQHGTELPGPHVFRDPTARSAEPTVTTGMPGGCTRRGCLAGPPEGDAEWS